MAGVVPALPRRVGHRHHDALACLLGILAQLDGVPVRLAHLPPVEPQDLRDFGQVRVRLDQHRLARRAVQVVEAADQLARELEMRDLVLPDRHCIGAVQRHVRGLQHGIAEEAEVVQLLFAKLLLLFLVGRNALEPADRRHHPEEQEQLGVLLDVALDEQRAPLRIEPGGDPVDEHLPLRLGDLRRILVVGGERVPVGGEVEAVRHLGQLDPALQRALVVPQVHPPGGAHPRDDPARDPVGRRPADRRLGFCHLCTPGRLAPREKK